MTIKMQSLKRHPWDGGFRAKGDEFTVADETQARTVEALGWASRAAAPKPAVVTKVEATEKDSRPAPVAKRAYKRRDLKAE